MICQYYKGQTSHCLRPALIEIWTGRCIPPWTWHLCVKHYGWWLVKREKGR